MAPLGINNHLMVGSARTTTTTTPSGGLAQRAGPCTKALRAPCVPGRHTSRGLLPCLASAGARAQQQQRHATNDNDGGQQTVVPTTSNPAASPFLSFAKLLTLTSVMAASVSVLSRTLSASDPPQQPRVHRVRTTDTHRLMVCMHVPVQMLLERRPAHAAAVKPEPIHTVAPARYSGQCCGTVVVRCLH